MGTIRIENRGSNLINSFVTSATDGTAFKIGNKYYSTTNMATSTWYFKIAIDPNFSYNFSVKSQKNAELKYLFSNKDLNDSASIIAEVNSKGQVISANPETLTNLNKHKYLYITFRTNTNGVEAYIEEPKLIDTTSESNNINISEFIEIQNELFGMFGVYDELTDDGTLIKRWKKETGISITSGSGTVSASGAGMCLLINEANKLPYEGIIGGTAITTSAPDGIYTVIYQLAIPEISTLYLPEKLTLYSGDNNILVNGGTAVLTTDANIEYHL